MQLFDMFGEPPQFTVHEMMMILRSGVFLKYAAAVVVLLAAFDTDGYRQAGMPLHANVLLWVICVAGFITFYTGILLAWVALAPGGRVVRVLRAVPNVISMALVTVLVVSLAVPYTGTALSWQVVLQLFPYNVVLSYTFETLLFLFILPQANTALGLDLYGRKQQGPEKPASAAVAGPVSTQPELAEQTAGKSADGLNGTAVVVLSGHAFRLDQLHYVKSEEHYLRISAGGSELTLRGRLADLLAQMPQDAGLQPHRSWWVARNTVTGLKRCGQSDVLLLADGCEVPVARGRRAQVREILRGWQIEGK
ncbi:LytTR family DNA-binding domain-containing protein [Leisingera sp. SS27]|uniref:LytTR family DNA-binding domain-containing protein n=1 Tax=Leisingera sp. SS27 TaxID=2979462 RepID=UPI00232B8F42|nr:LytTR family DNA-binding domain-containing protein [Leisingera sp. SS27]MDC0660809.1 LytTR family DNA-binding domain-containing protein [Leisingera sp. SS27]